MLHHLKPAVTFYKSTRNRAYIALMQWVLRMKTHRLLLWHIALPSHICLHVCFSDTDTHTNSPARPMHREERRHKWEGYRCGLRYRAQQMEGVGGADCENVVNLEDSQVYRRLYLLWRNEPRLSVCTCEFGHGCVSFLFFLWASQQACLGESGFMWWHWHTDTVTEDEPGASWERCGMCIIWQKPAW